MENENEDEDFENITEGQTVLQLNYKGLHQIPECLLKNKKYYQLERLYLKRNLLKALPNDINNLTSLVDLYLHSNEITKLPEDLSGLTNLEYLDVSSNHLTAVSAAIGQLSNLKKLHLSNNSINRLPKEIGQLENLITLEAMNNNMNYLPLQLFDCHRLVTLNIDNNRLTTLPRQLYRLKNLSEISVCGNNLIVIPQMIGAMETLMSVYIDNNPRLYALPVSSILKQVGFNRCGTHILQDSLLESFHTVSVRHTKTSKLSIPIPQEINSVGSTVNCVPSLLEFCLRTMYQCLKITRTHIEDYQEFILANVPCNLRSLLLYPTAVCQYCQREVFVMAFPIIFQGQILLNPVYLLGLCCSLKCVKLCFSVVNFPLVFPRLEDLSLAIVLA